MNPFEDLEGFEDEEQPAASAANPFEDLSGFEDEELEQPVTETMVDATEQAEVTDSWDRGLPPAIVDIIKNKAVSGRGNLFNESKARQMADLERLRIENPVQAQMIEETSPLEAGLIGAGRGVVNLGRGLGLVEPEDPTVTKAINDLKGQQAATSIGEFAGSTAPFLAGGVGLAGVGGRGAQLAIQSGLAGAEGGISASGEGASTAGIIGSTLAGGAFGAAGQALAPVISKAANIYRGFKNPVDEIEATAAKKLFDKYGLELTAAENSANPQAFAELQAARAKSQAVQERLLNRDMQIADVLQGKIDDIQGHSADAPYSVNNAILGKQLAVDTKISDAYKEVFKKAENNSVKLNSSVKFLDNQFTKDFSTGGEISALKSDLINAGAYNGVVDGAQVELVRQKVNSQLKDAMKSGNTNGVKFLREFKNQLDQDVLGAVGEDVFAGVRKMTSEAKQAIERAKVSKYDTSRQSFIEDMMSEKMTGQDLAEGLTSGRYRRDNQALRDLKEYMTTGTPEEIAGGTAAFRDLQAATMEEIYTKALGTRPGSNEVGALNFKRLDDTIRKIGVDNLEVMFGDQGVKFLNEMKDLARYMTAPKRAKDIKETSLLSAAGKSLTSSAPYAGLAIGGTPGLMAGVSFRSIADAIRAGGVGRALEKKVFDLEIQHKRMLKQQAKELSNKIGNNKGVRKVQAGISQTASGSTLIDGE